jgi:hypothetical protein
VRRVGEIFQPRAVNLVKMDVGTAPLDRVLQKALGLVPERGEDHMHIKGRARMKTDRVNCRRCLPYVSIVDGKDDLNRLVALVSCAAHALKKIQAF